MKSIPSCKRVLQTAFLAVCALLCLSSARGQVIAVPLELRCPTNVVLWTCGGEIPWQSPVPVPTGGCSNYTVVCDPPLGTVLKIGVNQVACRVIDGCEKVDSCTFNITVRRDVEPPSIRCPSNLVVQVCQDATGGCGGVVHYPPPLATDNSGAVAVTCNPASGSILSCGVHVVTCVAVDPCQNRDTCEFTVTVRPGGEPPVIRCPEDQTVLTCSNRAVVVYPAPQVIPAGTTVVCSPPSGASLPIGSHPVTCVASNACGVDRCEFKIEVRPIAPPSITCPPNVQIVLPCFSNCLQVAYAPPTVVNGVLAGCSPPPGACLTPGLTTVTCVATNRCGDRDVCQFEVRVVQGQGTPPQILCPTNLTVSTCSNCQVVAYAPPVVNNGVLVRCSPPSGTCFPLGDTVVICEASNACARAECSFKITVRPVPPPQIHCPTNTIILTVPCGSNCVPVVYPAPTVANGTLVSCNPPPGTCLPMGLHPVICRATNSCGARAECEFAIRIVQGQDAPPVIECPRDLTVTACSNTCQVVTYSPPTVVNGTLVACQPPSGSCFPLGVSTVTCIASNACGRSECKFTITVRPGDACVKAPLNMVLWLPFDEPAGFLAHNIVAGAPNGIHVNGPLPVLGQKVLNSLGFDGVNDFVRVPNYAAIQLSQSDLTIDAWVLRRPGPAGQVREVLVSKVGTVPGAAGNRGYEFYLNNGVMNLALGGVVAQNYNSGALVPLDNQWHHVAVTVRRSAGGNVRFYLDGIGVASLAGPITAPLGTTWPLYVGAGTFPVPHAFFRGAIDEVEIFNRVLSPAEIAGLWNADKAGKCKIKCSIPWDVTYPSNQACITVLARIWNCSAVPQPVVWTATGPMPIPTPSGALVIPPFTCTNVPIVLCRPTNGLPVGSVVRWNLSVESGGQCPIVCVGSVINPGPLVVTVPVLPIAIAGTTRVELIRVGLNGLPPGQPVRIRAVGPDMRPDTMFISINGLPPGQPWIRGGAAAGGEGGNGGGTFEVPVRFLQSDPIGLYTILLETDVDGDGADDTVGSFDVENPVVPPPTLQLVSREGRFVLVWEDGGDGLGVLETSKAVDGPWEPVPNAAPGYPLNSTTETQFFRVVVP